MSEHCTECGNDRIYHADTAVDHPFTADKREFKGAIILTKPEDIQAFRLLALKGALSLESKGLRRRGRSALSVVKQEFGLKGRTAADVLPKFEALLRERGVLVD